MTRTALVELEADVLERLENYVAEFAGGFGYITRTRWAGIYLQGLFLDGERKSIEPLSRRVSVPGWRGDTEQALQQFVNQSVWDEQVSMANEKYPPVAKGGPHRWPTKVPTPGVASAEADPPSLGEWKWCPG